MNRPITHPLAIAKLEAEAAAHEASLAESMVKLDSEMATTRAWRNADCPLYADLAPMPAPVLGMRVWAKTRSTVLERPDAVESRTWDVDLAWPGMTWDDVTFGAVRTDEIVCITNYFKGDVVLWERE